MEIKIISLNVNSLIEYRRKYLLNEFITNNPVHVYCIQETKFGPHHNYFFSSYTTLLASNRTGCGGATLLVHSGLKIRNPGMTVGEIDCAYADVFIGGEWIKIGSIYVHPLCGNLDFLTAAANLIYCLEETSMHATLHAATALATIWALFSLGWLLPRCCGCTHRLHRRAFGRSAAH